MVKFNLKTPAAIVTFTRNEPTSITSDDLISLEYLWNEGILLIDNEFNLEISVVNVTFS